MYKLFITLIIFLVFLSTILICVVNPKMHKTVFIFDSEYQIAENNVEVETKTNIPTKEAGISNTTVKKTVNSANQKVVKKSVTYKQVQNYKTTTPKKEISKTTVKKNVSQPKTTGSSKKTVTTKSLQKTVSAPKTNTTTITESERVRQETILWNKWRSDLQNQIMSDTKLPIVPQGTIFKFSFDVDKFGKVSNVHTWSTNPSYTPYAIQYIAPVIRSYQGRSILNFPSGSNRVATTVNGGWKISTTSKYSTSADYNDSERINK